MNNKSPDQEEKNVETDPQQQTGKSESLQKQVEKQGKKGKKFGTFTGVFTPTLLTILGVILFLREGWVVGNAGLLGSWLIILLAFMITGCTALSMSSFVTNTRVGAGGPFAIVSQALGLEIGGSIGIPLYFSQMLATTMYIFGFRAGWLWIFPEHNSLLIDYAAFSVIFLITLVSTAFAFRIQFVILAIIIGSIGSIAFAAFQGSMVEPIDWWGSFEGSMENQFKGIGFWGVFAVFFPASTGIMAGASMSGDLKDPRKNIPKGTLSAILISFFVYMLVAYFLASSATKDELLKDYTILIDVSFYSPLTLAGLLAATFSSALSSFIGAPRILEALGSHNILFKGEWLSKRTKRGEPFNAIILTFAFIALIILLRDLNIVALFITMVFLITYSTINLVVLIEQSLELISFRLSFKVPRVIPLLGFFGSMFAMFIISPIFGLISIMVILSLYFVLMQKKLKSPFSDVRSGLFEALAEWSAKKVTLLHGKADRAWKPNILLPIDNVERLTGVFRLVHHLAHPVGSVKLLGIQPKEKVRVFEKELENSTATYLKHGVFASFSVMDEEVFSKGVIRGMQALRGAYFRPNILFLELPKDKELHKELSHVIEVADYSKMGVSLIMYHPEAGLGKEEVINLWIPRPKSFELEMKLGNIDLAILLGYRLRDSWQGKLNIYTLAHSEKEKVSAEKYLRRLCGLSRLPVDQTRVIVAKNVLEALEEAPSADLNITSFEDLKEVDYLWKVMQKAGSSCLFCKDSDFENAFA